jgi:hypothetical protein
MQYVKPTILASYSEKELTAEAAVCTGYGHNGINGGRRRKKWFFGF